MCNKKDNTFFSSFRNNNATFNAMMSKEIVAELQKVSELTSKFLTFLDTPLNSFLSQTNGSSAKKQQEEVYNEEVKFES